MVVGMEMKKLVSAILGLGTILASIIAIKYSSLPIYYSNSFMNFFFTTLEERQTYSLWYDLSVGYIMSAMFYFIVEGIPDIIRRYRAKKLIHCYVNSILSNMEMVINLVAQRYSLNINVKEMAEKDFLVIDGDINGPSEEISFSVQTYNRKSRKRITGVHTYGTLDSVVKNSFGCIYEKILVVKEYEYFYLSCLELVEIIRKIENCQMMKQYSEKSNEKENPCFLFGNSSAALNEFLILYLQLSKLKFHTEYSVTSLDSREKTIEYHNNREAGTFLNELREYNGKRSRAIASNPTLIVCSNKHTSRILAVQLQKEISAEIISFLDVKNKYMEHYKSVILIIDNYFDKNVARMLAEANLKLILVSEYHLKTRSQKKYFEGEKCVVIEELFFKSTFKILDWCVLKNEPSRKSIGEIIAKINELMYPLK